VYASVMWSHDTAMPIAAVTMPTALPRDLRKDDDRIDLMERIADASDMVSLGDACSCLNPPYAGMGARGAAAWSMAQTVAWSFPRIVRGTNGRRHMPVQRSNLQFSTELRSSVRIVASRTRDALEAFRIIHRIGTTLAAREAVCVLQPRWRATVRATTVRAMYTVEEVIMSADVYDLQVRQCAVKVHRDSERLGNRDGMVTAWTSVLNPV